MINLLSTQAIYENVWSLKNQSIMLKHLTINQARNLHQLPSQVDQCEQALDVFLILDMVLMVWKGNSNATGQKLSM